MRSVVFKKKQKLDNKMVKETNLSSSKKRNVSFGNLNIKAGGKSFFASGDSQKTYHQFGVDDENAVDANYSCEDPMLGERSINRRSAKATTCSSGHNRVMGTNS